jgi:hypothetical protein
MKRRSLAYSVFLGVRVPDYEIERRLWINEHYEGSYLFQNSIVLEIVQPEKKGEKWKINYSWQNQGFNDADSEIDPKRLRGGKVEVSIPFDSETTPGVRGKLRFVISAWNADAVMRE